MRGSKGLKRDEYKINRWRSPCGRTLNLAPCTSHTKPWKNAPRVGAEWLGPYTRPASWSLSPWPSARVRGRAGCDWLEGRPRTRRHPGTIRGDCCRLCGPGRVGSSPSARAWGSRVSLLARRPGIAWTSWTCLIGLWSGAPRGSARRVCGLRC